MLVQSTVNFSLIQTKLLMSAQVIKHKTVLLMISCSEQASSLPKLYQLKQLLVLTGFIHGSKVLRTG